MQLELPGGPLGGSGGGGGAPAVQPCSEPPCAAAAAAAAAAAEHSKPCAIPGLRRPGSTALASVDSWPPTDDSPFTPPSTSALAFTSPGSEHGATLGHAVSVGGNEATAAAPADEAAVSTATAGPTPGLEAAVARAAAELLARAERFAATVLRSRLLQSALLALEAAGSHPILDGEHSCAAGLEWTLAQLFALHAKAGYATATEPQLMAALWTLEAWGDAERSSCSGVLYSYLEGLPLYDAPLAQELAADWQRQFAGMRHALAAAQAELLTRLRWAVRLDFATEVAPSRDLLFAAPRPGSLLHAAAAAAAAWGPCQAAQGAAASTGAHATAGASSTARQLAQPQPSRPPALLAWVPELERLCLAIAQHAAVLRAGPEQPPKRRRFI